ncbi:DNA cytosine methyltransferase [Sinorhizobium meliloti]|nr:DNA cytosine methyltransferase [Sinorhizobium meliloti]
MNHLFPEDNTIRVLDLFSAAAGGWSLGMHRAGYRTIAACEVIDWRRALYSENNPGVPVYDDVTTLTADRLVRDGVGLPDIVVGSPPCQDISSANTKGKGVDGERSSLYFEAVRIIDECRPRWFALENSANLRTRGADRVIDALAAIGYTCWPFVVSAGDIGANHERKRSWLVGFRIADADGIGRDAGRSGWRSRINVSFPDDSRDTNQAIGAEVGGICRGPESDDGRSTARHASQDGCGQGRSRGYSVATEGLPVQACGDGADTTQERPQGESWCDEQRPGEEPEHADVLAGSEMGGSSCTGQSPAEPWADWNGGLAHHLRVDDGLSGWVAKSRIKVGGPKGTVAASLIVEAFGDAVCPQIPEAIGRAILRVERALAAVANDNTDARNAA